MSIFACGLVEAFIEWKTSGVDTCWCASRQIPWRIGPDYTSLLTDCPRLSLTGNVSTSRVHTPPDSSLARHLLVFKKCHLLCRRNLNQTQRCDRERERESRDHSFPCRPVSHCLDVRCHSRHSALCCPHICGDGKTNERSG